ncbi:MAG: hypothetical protein DMC60_14065 [Verrucomicrobia bacterium]|nr:MAG: hypothetical protein DMC60_14065 [Verrucomicrobiota bacterium]
MFFVRYAASAKADGYLACSRKASSCERCMTRALAEVPNLRAAGKAITHHNRPWLAPLDCRNQPGATGA